MPAKSLMTSIAHVLCATTLVVCGAACQQTELIFRPTGQDLRAHEVDTNDTRVSRALLVVQAPQRKEGAPQKPNPVQDPPEPKSSSTSEAEESDASQDKAHQESVQQIENDQVVTTPYTSPRAGYRALHLGMAGALLAIEVELTGAGREASESLLVTPEGVAGRLGAIAPPTMIGGAIVSVGGRGVGRAEGIGFAASQTIFTRQINPLSGVNGRCGDLTRAGFFGGNHERCVRELRR